MKFQLGWSILELHTEITIFRCRTGDKVQHLGSIIMNRSWTRLESLELDFHRSYRRRTWAIWTSLVPRIHMQMLTIDQQLKGKISTNSSASTKALPQSALASTCEVLLSVLRTSGATAAPCWSNNSSELDKLLKWATKNGKDINKCLNSSKSKNTKAA